MRFFLRVTKLMRRRQARVGKLVVSGTRQDVPDAAGEICHGLLLGLDPRCNDFTFDVVPVYAAARSAERRSFWAGSNLPVVVNDSCNRPGSGFRR